MANEILKDEILKDEELEQVAGGNVSNTASDSQFLRDVGVDPTLKGWGNSDTNKRFDEISGYVKEAWAKAGIDFTGNKDGDNVYKLGGNTITRKEAYEYVMKLKKKHLPLSRYDFKTV